MTKFFDDEKIATISMTDNRTGCDWESDFFDCGGLEYDDELEAYRVKDVEYLIEYAEDYMHGIGDFCGEYPGHKQGTLNYTIRGRKK